MMPLILWMKAMVAFRETSKCGQVCQSLLRFYAFSGGLVRLSKMAQTSNNHLLNLFAYGWNNPLGDIDNLYCHLRLPRFSDILFLCCIASGDLHIFPVGVD